MIHGKGTIYIGGKALPDFIEGFRLQPAPSLEKLAEKAKNLGSAFSTLSESMTLTCNGLTESWLACAEVEYLNHHKRLPGSDKTKRLRKKKRDIVLRWFLGRFGLGRERPC